MAQASTSAEPYLPTRGGLAALRDAAAQCRGCSLYEPATQTVFGAGRARAQMLLIGEQPGDQEDRAGEPFVGPAGRILDRAITDVGFDRDKVYITNVVKHFKFVPAARGKRRLHKTPNQGEIEACRPWWLAELQEMRPEIVVCLGATAAKALLSSSFRVSRQRGTILEPPDSLATGGGSGCVRVLATIHPSAVLRAKDRDVAYAGFREDLATAVQFLDCAGNESRSV